MQPTRDQILAEPAGPRLDKWVAEATGIGWQGGNPIPGYNPAWLGWPPPASTNRDAAMEALERYPRARKISWDEDGYLVTLKTASIIDAWALADTLPLAICRALLLAAIGRGE